MRVIGYIAFLILVAHSTGMAAGVRYVGTPPESQAAFENQIRNLRRTGIADRELIDSVGSVLLSKGYLDGRASVEEGQLIIQSGQRYMLDELVVTGDSIFTIPTGTPFTREAVEEALDELLSLYRSSGHYYASLAVSEVRENDGGISVHLSLMTGPVVVVGDNLYTGLERTDPVTISRHLAVSPGDTLFEGTIAEAEGVADEIEFVTFQRPIVIRPRPGFTSVDLEYRFREKKQVRFVGGGGYLPDDREGLVWNISLDLTNLFGQGREIGIKSERPDKGRTLLEIRYRHPLYLLGVDRLELSIATRDYREEFYEFALETRYSTRLSTAFGAGLGFGWKRVVPAKDETGYSRYSVTYSIRRSTLDNKRNPSRGTDLSWGIRYAYRRYFRNSNEQTKQSAWHETNNVVALKFYWPLSGLLTGHLGLNYNGLETSEDLPPVSELVRIGGPGTIRGYRNEQFVAQRAAFGTFEPRLRLSQSYFFVFYDAAYINRPLINDSGEPTTDESFHQGYGLGLSLIDAERSMILSIGWSPELTFDQPHLSVEVGVDF